MRHLLQITKFIILGILKLPLILVTLALWLTLGDSITGDAFAATLDEMAESDNNLVRRSANAFMNADTKVKDNIMSTLDSHLAVWDSLRLSRVTVIWLKASWRIARAEYSSEHPT